MADVVFDLDAAAFSGDAFRMYEFKVRSAYKAARLRLAQRVDLTNLSVRVRAKVKRCPRVKPHDFAGCPFAHTGEKAKRRDPRICKYSGTACPEFRRNGCCRRSDACPFAHGIFECWMHPSRYRTQMCSEVLECKRRVCFFAHTEDELRRPVDDTTWMQQHGAQLMDMDSGCNQHLPTAPSQTEPQLLPVPSITNQAANPAAQPDVWSVLQQLASNGQLDASQLLQLVQALGPQNLPAAGSRQPMPAARDETLVSLPALKSRVSSTTDVATAAGAANEVTAPTTPATPAASIASTSVYPHSELPSSPEYVPQSATTPEMLTSPEAAAAVAVAAATAAMPAMRASSGGSADLHLLAPQAAPGALLPVNPSLTLAPGHMLDSPSNTRVSLAGGIVPSEPDNNQWASKPAATPAADSPDGAQAVLQLLQQLDLVAALK